MNFVLYYIFPFVLVLGILIFFHELGHFLVAKYFGVKVLKFSLGFGPKLTGKKIGETEYLVSLIPLGGYIKMLGENIDEEDDPLPPEEDSRSFNKQHVLKRMGIVFAGPFFNMLLALLIFSGVYIACGTQVMIPEIEQVRQDSPASRAGLKKGDIIFSIEGNPITTWTETRKALEHRAGEPVEIAVKRDDRSMILTVVPEASVVKNIFGEEVTSSLIGIVASGKFKTIVMGPAEATKEGFKKTWQTIKLTCLTIVKLFQRVVSIKALGGPIMISQMTGQLAQENLTYLFPFMAIISINLGILNLLPIPILDGGLIVFLFIELIIGKPLSLKMRDAAQKTGLFLLLLLMAVVIYNDIMRIIG